MHVPTMKSRSSDYEITDHKMLRNGGFGLPKEPALSEFEIGERMVLPAEFESASKPREGFMIGRYTTGA